MTIPIEHDTVRVLPMVRCEECIWVFKHKEYINGKLVLAEYFCDRKGGKETTRVAFCRDGERSSHEDNT